MWMWRLHAAQSGIARRFAELAGRQAMHVRLASSVSRQANIASGATLQLLDDQSSTTASQGKSIETRCGVAWQTHRLVVE